MHIAHKDRKHNHHSSKDHCDKKYLEKDHSDKNDSDKNCCSDKDWSNNQKQMCCPCCGCSYMNKIICGHDKRSNEDNDFSSPQMDEYRPQHGDNYPYYQY